MVMIDRWLDMVDAVVDAAWYGLMWVCRVAVILGALAGCAYVAVEGLPFSEWIRVEVVIDVPNGYSEHDGVSQLKFSFGDKT